MQGDGKLNAHDIAREAAKLPASQRAEYLARVCGSAAQLERVEALLAQQSARTFVGSPLDAPTISPLDAPTVAPPPSERDETAPPIVTPARGTRADGTLRIGAYTIERILGEGGMGVVYLAQQERPRRTVALKVIRPGILSPRLLRRFEHESQILGRLQHPGIAQIYEAGQYDAGGGGGPQPFFAMEYVQGEPLTQFVNSRDLGVPEKLRLFRAVCDAVQHAHVKGVVHRDLKPANILVQGAASQGDEVSRSQGVESEPRGSAGSSLVTSSPRHLDTFLPKVLDFGVARATDSDIAGEATMQTAAGQLVGTVPYMSPEQIAGNPDEVDARSDVYTLGVILYEMLAGQLPHKVEGKTIVEAARTIGFEEPTPLGSLDRALRGDLQTIVGKALEKDKARRYQSPADLAADLHRYLADEPILARPPTTVYQLSKFAKRHKGFVVGAVFGVLALLGGIFATTWQAIEATRGRELAEQRRVQAETAQKEARDEAENARAMSDFLGNMLASVDPEAALGREVTVREVLDQAGRDVGKALEDRPRIEASLRTTMARTYQSLGRMDEAEANARASLELRRKALGEDHPEVIESMRSLASVLGDRGKLEEAGALSRAAYDKTLALKGDKSVETGVALGDIARVLLETGKLDEGEKTFREAIAIVDAAVGPQDEQANTLRHNLAIAIKDRGRFQEGIELMRPVLAARRAHLGPDHPSTLSSLNSMAALVQKAGNNAEAAELLKEALESRRRVLGANHPSTLTSALNLGVTLVTVGTPEAQQAAEKLFREAMAGLEKSLGEEHSKTQIAINSLAYVLEDEGRLEEAEQLYRRCVDIRKRTKGDRDQETWGPMNNLASLLQRTGKLEEAAGLYEELMRGCRAALPAGHYYIAIFQNNQGECLTAMKRYEEAERALLESLPILEKTLGATNPRVAKGKKRLVVLYEVWGKVEEAGKYRNP